MIVVMKVEKARRCRGRLRALGINMIRYFADERLVDASGAKLLN